MAIPNPNHWLAPPHLLCFSLPPTLKTTLTIKKIKKKIPKASQILIFFYFEIFVMEVFFIYFSYNANHATVKFSMNKMVICIFNSYKRILNFLLILLENL